VVELSPVCGWGCRAKQYLALGAMDEDRRAAYRQLFKTITPEDELTTIRDATNKGWALGSDRFASEIEALSARRGGVGHVFAP
jgi:putative transposase